MGLVSGPISFQRFFIQGRMVRDPLDERLFAALNARAFGRLAPLPDDTQIGWIGPRHYFETELAAEHSVFGPYVLIAVRLDRLRAPAGVLKSYIRLEEEAAREAGGKEFLSQGEKRKAREAALLRAEQEAKAGDFRRITAAPLLIDLPRQIAYLGGLSTALGDKVMQLFADTFGCALEPATPARLADRLLAAGKNQRALENLPPSHLVRPPEGAVERGEVHIAGDLSFLGRELLTWLWHQVERDEGALRIGSGDDVTVGLERMLRLKCDFGLTGTTTIMAEQPAGLPEARAALATGKQPVKAGLVLGVPYGEIKLTLDAARFGVSGLVIPEDAAEQDWRARRERRFERIGEAAALLDALFELFLARRVGREWNRDVRELSAWATGSARAARLQTA